MGMRINVLLDHDIYDYRDQSDVLARLEATTPATLAVRDYWNAASVASQPKSNDRWVADPVVPHERNYRSYTGPGSLFLKVGPHTAKIRTGGRWRGFLSIPPLHQVHLQAFRSIAEALGATQLAYFPDDDDLYDVFYGGGSLSEGLAVLERDFGPPQPNIEAITSEVAEETEDHVPCVWYAESLTGINKTC